MELEEFLKNRIFKDLYNYPFLISLQALKQI